MTIDKRKLFIAAWAYAKAQRVAFGVALKAAWAYAKARVAKAAPKPELTVGQKLDQLAGIALGWGRDMRKTFAYRFIVDNAQRQVAFGDKLRLSDKQIAVINDLYAKHA